MDSNPLYLSYVTAKHCVIILPLPVKERPWVLP